MIKLMMDKLIKVDEVVSTPAAQKIKSMIKGETKAIKRGDR